MLFPARGSIARDEYVLLEKDDFESVKLESTHIIDIEKFTAREPMRREGTVGDRPAVMSTRERVRAIEIEEFGAVYLMAALEKSLQGSGPGHDRADRYAAARANRIPSPRRPRAA